MNDEDKDVAVVLVDISGSTALYESVGNVEAYDQIGVCLNMLGEVILAHDGQRIHSKGDDVLCVFKNPKNAFAAVKNMLENIREGPLSLHAGIDYGPVVRALDDVFGDVVNTAARLTDLANSGEVLCSQKLYDQLDDRGKAKLRFFDSRQFKGKVGSANVYSFSDTEPGQETQVVFVETSDKGEHLASDKTKSQTRIAVKFGDQLFVCTSDHSISIGRSSDCDVVVSKPWVSRLHVTLSILQDHAYLRDTSTSGTYVCFDNQSTILARRETVLLPHSCKISLAKNPQDQGAELIECQVNSTQ